MIEEWYKFAALLVPVHSTLVFRGTPVGNHCLRVIFLPRVCGGSGVKCWHGQRVPGRPPSAEAVVTSSGLPTFEMLSQNPSNLRVQEAVGKSYHESLFKEIWKIEVKVKFSS